MFKNLSKVLLVCLLLCICVYIGVFIGRTSSNNVYTVSQSDLNETDTVNKTRDSFQKIDLNTATVQQLTDIPGVGQRIASAIIEYRDDYGKYYDVKELLDVGCVSEELYDTMILYVTVSDE